MCWGDKGRQQPVLAVITIRGWWGCVVAVAVVVGGRRHWWKVVMVDRCRMSWHHVRQRQTFGGAVGIRNPMRYNGVLV